MIDSVCFGFLLVLVVPLPFIFCFQLYAKTVTLGKTHWPETNRVMLRNRRIGCSMSGIAQFIAKFGMHLCDWKVMRHSRVRVKHWLLSHFMFALNLLLASSARFFSLSCVRSLRILFVCRLPHVSVCLL